MITAHDRTTLRRLREWLESLHAHNPYQYLAVPTDSDPKILRAPVSVQSALLAIRAVETAVRQDDTDRSSPPPRRGRYWIDLVLADMERLSADHAPWVGLAAVRSWITMLRRAREHERSA